MKLGSRMKTNEIDNVSDSHRIRCNAQLLLRSTDVYVLANNRLINFTNLRVILFAYYNEFRW